MHATAGARSVKYFIKYLASRLLCISWAEGGRCYEGSLVTKSEADILENDLLWYKM